TDPWKVLVAVMLLNKTAGRVAIPIFFDVMDRWPTAQAMAEADVDEVFDCIKCLGLGNQRAKRLVELSRMYLDHPPVPFQGLECKNIRDFSPISHLPGSGQYAIDSYRIYCGGEDEWRDVRPKDKELIRYLKWRWALEGLHWTPEEGVIGSAEPSYLDGLVEQLILFDPYKGL
ncbi:DNA glycosylase, partial [Vararia minispora EC-137]